MNELTATMSLQGAAANTALQAAKNSKDSPEAMAKAASQFEALMIGQLLQSARSADGEGWMGTDQDDAGAQLTELSEQALSTALSAKGGLGLAKMITTGLTKTVAHNSQKQGD